MGIMRTKILRTKHPKNTEGHWIPIQRVEVTVQFATNAFMIKLRRRHTSAGILMDGTFTGLRGISALAFDFCTLFGPCFSLPTCRISW